MQNCFGSVQSFAFPSARAYLLGDSGISGWQALTTDAYTTLRGTETRTVPAGAGPTTDELADVLQALITDLKDAAILP